ncbi:MAG: ABC transporter permease [Desulfurococcales archaeon]|nr:ABC transporter permease [Desulfurococcales archaeon]
MNADHILTLILAAGPAFATYYLAAIGHGIFEKSGVLNLAIDGVFTLGVAVAFSVSAVTMNANLGLLASIIISTGLGVVIAYLTTKFPTSHGAIGLSTMFVGYGLASLIGVPVRSTTPNAAWYPINNWFWALIILIAIGIGVLVHYMLRNTKLGSSIRAAGENPYAASSLGVDILKVRLIAGAVGYALIGAGAALYVLAYTQSWSEGTGMGHGWVAFAVSLSAGRNALLTILSAAVFGSLVNYGYSLQAVANLSPHITNMLPFIAALVALVVFEVTPLKRKLAPPKGLGKVYFKEERTV